jgi:hypothetical protein
MVTVSTTTSGEAQDMAALMRQAPAGTAYEIYLAGHRVARGTAGRAVTLDLRAAGWLRGDKLPSGPGLPHPANRPERSP